MKKALIMTLAISVFMTAFVFSTGAKETNANEDLILLENGYYITVELNETSSRATNVKTGNKVYICKNSSGAEQWRATLNGTFTYTGNTSTCTASSCTVTVTNDVWYTISKTASKSGNAATADVVMGKKFLGIKIDEESVSMRLTCDANGNLS